jgi:hypothetical protein
VHSGGCCTHAHTWRMRTHGAKRTHGAMRTHGGFCTHACSRGYGRRLTRNGIAPAILSVVGAAVVCAAVVGAAVTGATHVGWAQAWEFAGLAPEAAHNELSVLIPLLPVQITDRVWKPLPQETEQLAHGDET